MSLSRCTRVSSAVISCSLLLSEFSSFQSTSFKSWIPCPVTEEMKTTGRSVGRVSFNISMSSSSRRSHLVMASTRCLSSISGLKFFNSPSNTSYSFLISSVSPGTIKSSRELRSIWRRNRKPKPFPSLAPSMMPGMSAMTKLWWSR